MFVHLHCHSHYSFLRGVASPEEIIAAATEQRMPAVGLTDTTGMYAAVAFYQKALEEGIEPVVDVVLDVSCLPELIPCSNETQHPARAPITLLAMNMEGYSNLCQLVTLRQLGTTKPAYLPIRQASRERSPQNPAAADTEGRSVTIQELAKHSRGVIALCPLPARTHDASTRAGKRRPSAGASRCACLR